MTFDLPLYDAWNLFLHYPNDQHWGFEGKDHYEQITTFKTIQDVLAINREIKDKLIQQCMIFVMKDGVQPFWEDPSNRNGGRFSFKIPNTIVPDVWRKLLLHMVSHTASNNHEFEQCINGISISPKKAFCIIKLWMKDCSHTSVDPIVEIRGLDKEGCIFKMNLPDQMSFEDCIQNCNKFFKDCKRNGILENELQKIIDSSEVSGLLGQTGENGINYRKAFIQVAKNFVSKHMVRKLDYRLFNSKHI